MEGPPKTDAGDRTIPIPQWLCEDLASMVAARDALRRDAYLFQTRYGNPLNRDDFREAVVRPALRAATGSAATTSSGGVQLPLKLGWLLGN